MKQAENVLSAFGLEGKNAIVTGAATGIGREIAELFARAGAKVVAADINEAAMATLAAEFEGVRTVAYDQGDPASIAAMFDKADGLLGQLDVLVNCAAIYSFKAFEDVEPAYLRKIVDIDLAGPFYCCQHAVRRMKKEKRGGSIINISSVNSMRACIFDNIHYGVSKGGVNNLTISLALEYAADGIRTNAVMPGGIASEHAMKVFSEFPNMRGPFMQPDRVPLGGASGKPIDIARTCLFLASDASSYITGQLIAVDGGFLIS